MIKNIYILLVLLILSCCAPSKYSNTLSDTDKTIAIEELKSNNEAIVVFGDKSYINFINLNNVKDSILIERYGNSKTKKNIVKIKSGRYILDAGLFKRTLRYCLADSGLFYFMIPVPFAVLSMPMPTGQFIEPMIDKNTSAVFYFDVSPGEIIYIGNIDHKATNCNIILENYLDDIVDDIKKDYPEIAHHLKPKLLKINKKPDACNFLIEDINDLSNKEKYNKFYKPCLNQLKALP